MPESIQSVIPFLPEVPPDIQAVVKEYDWALPTFSGKGWLSINNFMRCRLGCRYCFASHRDEELENGNCAVVSKKPIKIFSDESLVEYTVNHPYFRAELGDGTGTPLGLHTGTTEAFLPEVKESTFRILELLARRGLQNDVSIITKLSLDSDDIQRLEDILGNVRLNIMSCYSALPEEIEPFNSPGVMDKKRKMVEQVAYRGTPNLRIFHYMRPLAIGWNTSEEQIGEALRYGEPTTATVIGGISLTNLTQQILDSNLALPGGPNPGKPRDGWEKFGDGKKFLPPYLVDRILEIREKLGILTPLVRRSSCSVSIANSKPDYNAHRVESPEKNCLPSCPAKQQKICESQKMPTQQAVREALDKMGFPEINFQITEKAVILENAKDFPSFISMEGFALRHLVRFPVIFKKVKKL
jgi:hypothetical protein